MRLCTVTHVCTPSRLFQGRQCMQRAALGFDSEQPLTLSAGVNIGFQRTHIWSKLLHLTENIAEDEARWSLPAITLVLWEPTLASTIQHPLRTLPCELERYAGTECAEETSMEDSSEDDGERERLCIFCVHFTAAKHTHKNVRSCLYLSLYSCMPQPSADDLLYIKAFSSFLCMFFLGWVFFYLKLLNQIELRTM